MGNFYDNNRSDYIQYDDVKIVLKADISSFAFSLC
jgi:hypothetical protein